MAVMTDILNSLDRSERMSRIRAKDTKPELIVRKALWAAGFRYTLHGRGLAGKPDLVMPSIRTVIFVHGCYWHGHSCQKGRIPKQNSDFWRRKFDANMDRDRKASRRLRREGWSVLTVWECSLASSAKRTKTLCRLIDLLTRRRENVSLCPENSDATKSSSDGG